MMAEDQGQVLVTGGSGFLGGWCVIELLRRGYTVRTTVRSLSREAQVRAAVGSEVDPGDRLTVLAADLTSDEGWSGGGRGLRLRPACRLAIPAQATEGP